LNEKADGLVKTTELRAESFMISAMVCLFVFGLVAITLLIGVMKTVLGFNVGQIFVFALLSFLLMLVLEGVLIWRLPRRKRNVEEKGDAALTKGHATKELDAAHAGLLPHAVPSVTEETTRAFEPVYIDRTPK
jgi:TRAP-type C4-dicarboxylate transport system permease small subunit